MYGSVPDHPNGLRSAVVFDGEDGPLLHGAQRPASIGCKILGAVGRGGLWATRWKSIYR